MRSISLKEMLRFILFVQSLKNILRKICGCGQKIVTLHPQKWVLRWLNANNTLIKSRFAFSLEVGSGSF